MKIVTSEQIQNLDKKTINEFGLPGLVLMERAALGVCNVLKKECPDNVNSILVICGIGNNGGDGLAISRLLYSEGKNVNVILIGNNSKRSDDNILQLSLLKKLNVNVFDYEQNLLENLLNTSDIIIDSIFGVGLKRDIKGDYKNLIEQINSSNKKIISVDIPSGINADNGDILGISVKAHITVTFSYPKIGMFMDSSLDYIGNLHIVDIGIPKKYEHDINIEYINHLYINKIFNPKRKLSSHKGNFGKLAIIGGSETMSGAVVLSAKAAMKSGVGLLKVFVPDIIHHIVAPQIPSAMVIPLKSENGCINDIPKLKEHLDWSTALVFGPGIGNQKNIVNTLKYILKEYKNPILIDADGLNILSENIDLLKETNNSNIVLTPHIGEFSRLINKDINQVQKEKTSLIKDFFEKFNKTLVLKSARTFIAGENKIFINSTGSPALSRGGSGDILSGIIGTFLSQGKSSVNSSIIGVYIHGLMGEFSENNFNDNTIIADEMVDSITYAFNKIYLLKNH